jgi:hypothetical protein
LGTAASVAAFAVTGWARALAHSASPDDPPGPPWPLVDAHCHLFNITDLPVATFVQTVLLKDFAPPGGPTWRQRRLAAALRGIETILARRVPTAAQEARMGADRLFAAAPAAAPLSAAEERALREEETKAEAARPDRVPTIPDAAFTAFDSGGCEISRWPALSLRSVRTWLRNLRGPRTTIAPLLGEAIKRIADETSVSSLFD